MKIRWDLVYGPSVPSPRVLLSNNTNILSLKAKNPLASVFASFHCFDACGRAAMNGSEADLI